MAWYRWRCYSSASSFFHYQLDGECHNLYWSGENTSIQISYEGWEKERYTIMIRVRFEHTVTWGQVLWDRIVWSPKRTSSAQSFSEKRTAVNSTEVWQPRRAPKAATAATPCSRLCARVTCALPSESLRFKSARIFPISGDLAVIWTRQNSTRWLEKWAWSANSESCHMRART
jgi:hypothetical protein